MKISIKKSYKQIDKEYRQSVKERLKNVYEHSKKSEMQEHGNMCFDKLKRSNYFVKYQQEHKCKESEQNNDRLNDLR